MFDVVGIQDEMSLKGIDLQFTCPHNPAEGGIWERIIQCIKYVLQSTLKESRQLRDHFWNRWIQEYLLTLTRSSKWCQRTNPFAVGFDW